MNPTSFWLVVSTRPIWKIWRSKWDDFPKWGWKSKYIWNHHHHRHLVIFALNWKEQMLRIIFNYHPMRIKCLSLSLNCPPRTATGGHIAPWFQGHVKHNAAEVATASDQSTKCFKHIFYMYLYKSMLYMYIFIYTYHTYIMKKYSMHFRVPATRCAFPSSTSPLSLIGLASWFQRRLVSRERPRLPAMALHGIDTQDISQPRCKRTVFGRSPVLKKMGSK